jgi:DNA-binding GntR family transcriptional regulator
MPHGDWELDPDSSVPLHVQFEGRLRARIENGKWKPGDRIPSERALMALAGVSRATVRQAISALCYQNLLRRSQGSGTFVQGRKVEQPLHVAYSFSEQFRALGLQLVDQVLEKTLLRCPTELAEKLRIAPATEVIRIYRLRLLDGVPVMVNQSYIPYALCPALLDEPLDGSLYRTLADRYQLPVLRATDRFEAVRPDRTLCRLLHISANTPVLFVERVASTLNEVVLQVGETHIRSDMCYFRIDLQAQPTTLAVKPQHYPSRLSP